MAGVSQGGDGLVMVVGGTSEDLLLLLPIVLLRCSEL